MYLPNPNLHPTGAEPAEFIAPTTRPSRETGLSPASTGERAPPRTSTRRPGSWWRPVSATRAGLVWDRAEPAADQLGTVWEDC